MNIKGSVLIFLVLIVLAGGAFGTWYFMNQRCSRVLSTKDKEISEFSKQIADLVDELNELKNQDSSDSSIDTSNWLTYKNSNLSFSFKYPAEFARIQDSLISDSTKTAPSHQTLVLKNSSSQQQPILSLCINPTVDNPAADYLADYYYELTPTTDTRGLTVSTIKEHSKASESDPDLIEYIAYTKERINSLDFYFSFSHKPGSKNFQKIFEAVLESFALT